MGYIVTFIYLLGSGQGSISNISLPQTFTISSCSEH